jgi:hypothetical protein
LEAEAAYKTTLTGRKVLLGVEHTLTLDVVHDVGVLYLTQGRDREAEKMLD